MKLYNLARMTSATTGTGTLTLGAAVAGYLTFSGAGVADGDVVLYGIKDGSSSEVGWGTYTASGTTLSRNVYKSTNANALISCSGNAGQEVYITALAGDGGDLLPGSSKPLRGFDAPINLQLNAGNNGTKLTIAVKGNNGSDPSTTNPVLIPFRDATLANGGPVWVPVTAALSIDTNAAGATLGSANNVPFRLWVVAFNNAGTVVLGLWQSVTGGASPTAVAPLNEAAVASSTAMSGTANLAGTFYTPNGTTVASASFRILGYVDYASGLATAGTYASNPTTIQLFGPGIKKPGDLVQATYTPAGAQFSTTANTPQASNVTGAITPTSKPNIIKIFANAPVANANGAATGATVQIYNGSTALGWAETISTPVASFCLAPATLVAFDAPGSVASTTYTVKLNNGDNVTAVYCPFGANRGAVVCEEIMA
jgi:hypothetical protein